MDPGVGQRDQRYIGNYGASRMSGIRQHGRLQQTGADLSRKPGNNEKNIAEAISHEVGHNLGLSHDGISASGILHGQGNQAPIMGVGYYEPIVQWSRGDTPTPTTPRTIS